MAEHQQSTHEEYTLLNYQLNQNHHLHNLRERQEAVVNMPASDSQSDYLLLDPNRTPMHTHAIDEEPTQSSDYLFLGREQDDHHYQEEAMTATESPTSAPSMRGTKSFKINQEQETTSSNSEGKDRIRQSKPTTSQTHHYHTSIHTKTSHPDNTKDLPLSPSDSTSTLQFYDLRAGLQIYGLSPENINDVEDVPTELVELHKKNAREKNGVNPEDLPEVWMAPPAPDGENDGDGDDDEVELVQRAPDQDDTTSSSSNTQTMACRSIQGKYGERTLKNPGVILRYQYELIQDTNDIDYTYSSNNGGMEVRDGTEYLIENIVPSFEQGVGDVLVNALFEECGGGMRKKERRLLRFGTKKMENEHGLESWRELKSSTVVGLDGEPEDFPLGQGECISTYKPASPLQSFQCHIMEGAVTLYFPPNYSYPTVLTAATLQILRAIKEGMESGGVLEKSSDKILSLLFLDKSYNLKPIYPGEVVGGDPGDTAAGNRGIDTNDGGKSNVGLIVGMILLILILIGLAVGGYYYKTKQDEKFALSEQQRREAEALAAKTASSSSSRHGRGSSRNRRHAILEEEDNDGHTTSESEDEEDTTTDDGTTTSDDGTTTSDDDGTTTSGSDSSTTSNSKTTTSSDSDDSDDDSFSNFNYHMYKKKKAQKRVKRIKNNIVYTGNDDASVMTGATGMHSLSSVRTAKAKNMSGVNINMR